MYSHISRILKLMNNCYILKILRSDKSIESSLSKSGHFENIQPDKVQAMFTVKILAKWQHPLNVCYQKVNNIQPTTCQHVNKWKIQSSWKQPSSKAQLSTVFNISSFYAYSFQHFIILHLRLFLQLSTFHHSTTTVFNVSSFYVCSCLHSFNISSFSSTALKLNLWNHQRYLHEFEYLKSFY